MNKYFFITLKRYIEQLIMFPFVLAGNVIAMLRPLGKEYDFFIFFPIYGIGGAEKVNGEVIAALPDKQIIIFFTRKSHTDKLLHYFQKPNVTIRDISRWTDNKFIYWANLAYRGVCAWYINKQKKKPVIFNGQSNFAHKLFPHIRKDVLKVELIHTADLKFAWVTFPYIPFIDKRVMISQSIIDQHVQYYRWLGIPQKYENRIFKIVNSTYVPEQYTPKKIGEKLKVYYAGRGGHQKHLELVFEIMATCLQEGVPIECHLAGTFESEIPETLKQKVVWHGQIGSPEEMYKLHHQMDILLMTSRFEGFPLVIMEAMACGVAVVSTAVDGIPEHIKQGENGFLMQDMDDEKVVADGIKYLTHLTENREMLQDISRRNYEYARKNFTGDTFAKAYRRVFGLSD